VKPLAQAVGVAAALLAAIALGGCVVGIAAGAGSAAGVAASSERGFERELDDDRIWLEVSRRWLEHGGTLYRRVNVQVHEGRALLSGTVETQIMRDDAVRLARGVEGLRETIDEIAVGRPTDSNAYLRDIWIVRQLDAKLLLDGEIQAINYSIEAVGGTVYLIGVAQNREELQRVMNHARDIRYVRRVVSHVRVKGPAS
jgi:osmotically-inducible protein OsmY